METKLELNTKPNSRNNNSKKINLKSANCLLKFLVSLQEKVSLITSPSYQKQLQKFQDVLPVQDPGRVQEKEDLKIKYKLLFLKKNKQRKHRIRKNKWMNLRKSTVK